jgi:DNA polymerase-3 subunit alpha
MNNEFVHLHTHSDYSLLTGLAKVSDLVAKAKKDGMKALALTDLGNLYGVVEFYKTCKKNDIKPIIGVEMYIAPNGMHQKRPKIDEDRHSLVLLAENNVGYQNLLKLVSISYLEGFYYKPRIDLDVLKEYSEGLIALTSSLIGEIPRAILKNYDEERMDALMHRYLDVFGKDNLFIEIVRHTNIPEQELVNEKLIQVAKKYELGIVGAANSYYLNTEDDQAHDILLCIQNNRKVFEANRFTMMGEDYSFLPQAEMLKKFKDIPQAIDATVAIADRCTVTLEFGEHRLPAFDIPEGHTYESFLRLECYRGLVTRYGGLFDEGSLVWDMPREKELIEYKGKTYTAQDVIDRLEYELSVIEKTGFASYFLITSDFIKWSKKNGIMVGPGRGSAAGSMVAFLTEIVALDPLKYDLLFERFLNPERISMPDIDTDFADARRDDVIRYVENKYGKDKVSGIITFGTLGAKAVVRDVGRALGVEYAYCDMISKMIPMFTDLSTALEEVGELKVEYKNNPDCKKIIDNALKLEGAKRHASQHACGILITKDPLTEYVPVQRVHNDEDAGIVSQYSLFPVEDLGLLKMDFLGLKNLTIIENTLEAIEKIHGVRIDLDTLSFTDDASFELLQRGETTGVFQFESAGMKRYLKQLKPNELEDLIAMGALYRPGPLDAGMVDEYIERKHGKKEVSYPHEKLEPVLKDTYGVIVYQEQVMRIARDLAGFTLGQADVLRKAVGKKIKELMDQQKSLLVEGMVANEIPKKTALEIWDQIETFARYGFNRSHAACYGVIAYYTAYLKANYPAEFMAALLTADLHDIDRLAIEINECKQMGIEVLLPDVNESFTRFTVVAESLAEGKPRIRFGLSGIKGVGENIAQAIITERKKQGPFESLSDFLVRIQSRDLNKKSLDSLIRSGALDRFGDRNEMLLNLEKIQQFVKENNAQASSSQDSLFNLMQEDVRQILKLENYPPADKHTYLSWEKELLGFYLSQHPFEDYQKHLEEYIVDTVTLTKQRLKGHVRVAGLVSSVKKILTKKGEVMLFVNIEDTRGSAEVIVFPSVYATTAEVWQENHMVIVSGSISDRDDECKVICNEVKSLDLTVVRQLVSSMNKLTVSVANEVKDVFVFFSKIIGAETIGQLTDVLSEHKGDQRVYLAVPINDTKFRKIETNFHVDTADGKLVDKINQITEVKFVKFM